MNYPLEGGCHCGNLRINAELSRAPAGINPRACDCGFCRKHGAAYISDARGKLAIHVLSSDHTLHYRQGSGTVDFLLCRRCGVLACTLWQD